MIRRHVCANMIYACSDPTILAGLSRSEVKIIGTSDVMELVDESISGEHSRETSSLEDVQNVLADSASLVNEGSRLSECGCSYDCLPSPQMTKTIKTPQLSPPIPAVRNYELDGIMEHSFTMITDQDSTSTPEYLLQRSDSKGKMQAGKIEGAMNVENVVDKGNNETEVANCEKIQSTEVSGAESGSTKSIYLDDGDKKKQKFERKPPQHRLTKVCLNIKKP